MKNGELKKGERVLIARCALATGFFSRFLGLMGKRGISPEEAICFPKCNSIHTFFMRFPIDILFLSKEGEVIEVVEALGPWRLLLPRRGVAHTLELAAHLSKALGIVCGDRLKMEGVF